MDESHLEGVMMGKVWCYSRDVGVLRHLCHQSQTYVDVSEIQRAQTTNVVRLRRHLWFS